MMKRLKFDAPLAWTDKPPYNWFADERGLTGTSFSPGIEFPGNNRGRWRVWATSPTAGDGPKSAWQYFSFDDRPTPVK